MTIRFYGAEETRRFWLGWIEYGDYLIFLPGPDCTSEPVILAKPEGEGE